MRHLLVVLLLGPLAFAQTKNCTSVKDSAGNTTISCDDQTSAFISNVLKSGPITSYTVTDTTQPKLTPPPPQPIPLPALALNPPQSTPVNPNLMLMAAVAASNRPPSDRQLRKFCKKHHGEHWTKRNFNGIVVAEGYCPAN